MQTQQLAARVRDRVMEPAPKVFEAIVDPAQLSGYFTTRASARPEAGRAVRWTFDDVGGHLDVEFDEVLADRRLVFRWAASGTPTTVRVELAPENGSTLVDITEAGWPFDEAGAERAMRQTAGWTDFVCGLKAHLMCGVRLRTGRTAASH
jgi:uncharacterized protein YndB with AHSA1/START domain